MVGARNLSHSNNLSNVTIDALGGNDSIENSGSGVKIFGGANNDTITSGHIIYSEVVGPFDDGVTVYSTGGTDNFLDGGAGDDYIDNHEKYVWDEAKQKYTLSSAPNNSTLLGGAGDDTISNYGTFVAISGGAGKDRINNRAANVTIDGNGDNDSIENTGINFFVNGGGEDFISDYEASDKIRLGSSTLENISVEGSDVVFNFSSGKIIVADGRDKKITYVNSSGKTITNIYTENRTFDASKTSMTLGADFTGPLQPSDYPSTVKLINANGFETPLNIVGNAQANTIIGGDGNDVFVHEGGKDFIAAYTPGRDKIKLICETITGYRRNIQVLLPV